MRERRSIAIELRDATRFLDRAGILNPKREATAIWASLADTQPGDIWLRREEEVLESESRRFLEALHRRASGEPLPYVVGETGFRTLDIKVDRRVLIPRPETEGLVECVLEWCRFHSSAEADEWGVAVDVGTGSGCIALSLAMEGNFERVLATDNSEAALELATENVELVSAETPVEVRLGALLDPLGEAEVEVIVSNPPYVTISEYDMLDSSVTSFEPRNALVSGEDGMDHTRELLVSAVDRLVPGGLIAIEVDSTRAEMACDLACRLGWPNARVEADLFGRPRFLLATKEI
jgi:release factor glutamine methyltransferase